MLPQQTLADVRTVAVWLVAHMRSRAFVLAAVHLEGGRVGQDKITVVTGYRTVGQAKVVHMRPRGTVTNATLTLLIVVLQKQVFTERYGLLKGNKTLHTHQILIV